MNRLFKKCALLYFMLSLGLLMAQPNKGKVLLLATAFVPKGFYKPLMQEIEEDGFEADFLPMPKLGTNDFSVQAEVIHQYLSSLPKQEKVAVLAHSSGGIALRAYLKKYGNEKIGKIIYLGVPHLGADATTFYNKTIPFVCKRVSACHQLVIGGDYINQLNQNFPETENTSNLIIEKDTFVKSKNSTLNSSPATVIQSICPDLKLEHFSFVRNKKVILGIVQLLNGQNLTFGCEA
ncbi:MAG: hypothetical protein C4K58_00335 [Flavobacteriaceae bacterium]|nr:MAG: hypothetical protein C4K58_00335 [Flavobacteriaceae bacterium]